MGLLADLHQGRLQRGTLAAQLHSRRRTADLRAHPGLRTVADRGSARRRAARRSADAVARTTTATAGQLGYADVVSARLQTSAIHRSTSSERDGNAADKFSGPPAVTATSSSMRTPMPRNRSGTVASSGWK